MDLPRCRQRVPTFGSFLNSLHPHENSPCFGTKLYEGSKTTQNSFVLAGNMGWKKKTLGSSYGFEGNWKQVATGNKSNHNQVLPDTSITYPQNNKAAHNVALPPLSSFTFCTLPPMDQSPTVFLPASYLEVKPQVGLGLVNLSAAGTVEREATCSGGSGASASHTGLFFSLSLWPHGCCFRHVLFRDTTSLGRHGGPRGTAFSMTPVLLWRRQSLV